MNRLLILGLLLLMGATTVQAAPLQITGVTTTNTDAAVPAGKVQIKSTTAASTSAAAPSADSASATTETEAQSFSLSSSAAARGTVGASLGSIYDVRSERTFQQFAAGLMDVDPGLERVTMNKQGTVTLRYATTGKFLGFLPVRMPTFVDISTEGTVAVRYPWYSFITKPTHSRDSVQAALSAEAARTVSRGDNKNGRLALVTDDRPTNVDPVTEVVGTATGTPSAGTILSLRLRASLLDRMRSYLRAQETGALEVQATASTTVQ